MKKITIDQAILKDALKRIKQAVSSKPVLPQLGNVLFDVDGNSANPIVRISATDLDVTVQIEINASFESKEQFKFIVPFEYLHKIVNLSVGEITFTFLDESQENKSVEINTGNDFYTCGKMDDMAEYPVIPAIPIKKFIDLNGTFIETLNNAIVGVSKDDTRPAMCNVCLDISPEEVLVVSTDAHMLFTKKVASEGEHEQQILISPKVAKAIDGFTKTRISWSKDITAFVCDNVTVIAKNHDLKYPHWRSIIPHESTTFLTINKADLETALEKCNLNNTEMKQTLFTLTSEKLYLESTSFDDGKIIKTEVDSITCGDLGNICFNSKKLLQLLQSIKDSSISKDISVVFNMTTANKAAVIRTEEDSGYKLIMMPIMIN